MQIRGLAEDITTPPQGTTFFRSSCASLRLNPVEAFEDVFALQTKDHRPAVRARGW